MRPNPRFLAFALIATSTAIGIAGTDLILPAIPSLPLYLGGTAQQAQLVLAAFTGGAALGLLLFGELGARIEQRTLLLLSLLIYGAASLACTLSGSLEMLVGIRFMQGASGAAAAVFAPGMLRSTYGDDNVVKALGALGSVEALTPALAPLLGAWLFQSHGWRAGFQLLAALAWLLAAIIVWRHSALPRRRATPSSKGYGALLRNHVFLGHALGYACTLAGLLVFVFAAPTVFMLSLGATLNAFVLLQICGVSLFVIAATQAGRLVDRFGATQMVRTGSWLSFGASITLLAYAISGGARLPIIIALFAGVNLGLGFRGPPGFQAAIAAAGSNDARAAAVVVLSVLLLTALGTTVLAPFIMHGLGAIALGTAVLTGAGIVAVHALARE